MTLYGMVWLWDDNLSSANLGYEGCRKSKENAVFYPGFLNNTRKQEHK